MGTGSAKPTPSPPETVGLGPNIRSLDSRANKALVREEAMGMAAVVGLTLVKAFTYRGDANEEYSNQYWLSGGIPADGTAWKALADALIVQEKTIYPADCRVVRAYGYDRDDDGAPSVWSFDYAAAAATVPGTLAAPTQPSPGDSAVWIRWKTGRLNSKGKPIYLRKYYHPACAKDASAAGRDQVVTAQVAALTGVATALGNGSLLGSRTIRSQHHAEALQGQQVSTYITTRTLKRRGKRPGS